MNNLKIVVKSNSNNDNTQLTFFFNEKLKINRFILQKVCLKKLNKTWFTLLKSPNINKTAQEKFEKKTFNTKILFVINKFVYYLYFLKQLSQNFTFDCCLFLKYKVICKFNLALKQIIFNPVITKINKYNNKITNNFFFNFSFIQKSKVLFFFKIFSISGEFFKKQ